MNVIQLVIDLLLDRKIKGMYLLTSVILDSNN